MNLLERASVLLTHSRSDVLNDPSLTKELTDIFRFRGEDICSACPGVLSSKYDELSRVVTSGKFNNIFMAKNKNTKADAPKGSRRYMLPEGKAYRPFGMGVVYTNDNLTDEIVESLIKANPTVKKVFIDLGEQGAKAPAQPGSQDEDPTGPTLEELKKRYKEATGEDVPEDLSETDLRDLLSTLLDEKP